MTVGPGKDAQDVQETEAGRGPPRSQSPASMGPGRCRAPCVPQAVRVVIMSPRALAACRRLCR